MRTSAIRFEARLHTPPDDVNVVHEILERVWAAVPEITPGDRLRFETALIELSGNVFEHTCEEQGTECLLEVSVEPDALAAVVLDRGAEPAVSLERQMPEDLAESGRGIALIRALTDELSYERDGDWNRWRIVRHL